MIEIDTIFFIANDFKSWAIGISNPEQFGLYIIVFGLTIMESLILAQNERWRRA